MSLVYTAESTGVGKRNRLYIGSRSDAKNREKLLQWGITHILNVTPAKDAGVQSGVPNFFEKDRTFVYKRIPVYDASTSAFELLNKAEEIVDFIAKGLIHGGVLVHCNKGQSRSTTAALFYFLRKTNMSLNSSLEMIQRRRPEADPIPAFRAILEDYEAKCRKEGGDSGKSKGSHGAKSAEEPKKKKRVGPVGPPTQATRDDDAAKSNDKRRRIVGPVMMGPLSIGPSLSPAGPTAGSSSKINKKVIGPAMPSNLTEIGPSLPPTPMGPSLPPTADAEEEPPVKAGPSITIGPSLPPS